MPLLAELIGFYCHRDYKHAAPTALQSYNVALQPLLLQHMSKLS